MSTPTMPKTYGDYIANGCGRCALGGTPASKVHQWTQMIHMLRDMIISEGLTETIKWGSPCYVSNGENVLMIAAFKETCTLSFFKGSVLKDPSGLLTRPGPNSQHGRMIHFRHLAEIEQYHDDIVHIIQDARDVSFHPRSLPDTHHTPELPEELVLAFEEDPGFAAAFDRLTPGRRRGYLIYFDQAKQAHTRHSRIEKYKDRIMNGIGMHDRT